MAAAGCLLNYVKQTQRNELPHITGLQRLRNDEAVHIDGASRRNLELSVNIQGGEEHTLFATLNHASTAMGSRLLQRWINRPIRSRTILNNRFETISVLIEGKYQERLATHFRAIGDIERILRASPCALPGHGISPDRDALNALPDLNADLADLDAMRARELAAAASRCLTSPIFCRAPSSRTHPS